MAVNVGQTGSGKRTIVGAALEAVQYLLGAVLANTEDRSARAGAAVLCRPVQRPMHVDHVGDRIRAITDFVIATDEAVQHLFGAVLTNTEDGSGTVGTAATGRAVEGTVDVDQARFRLCAVRGPAEGVEGMIIGSGDLWRCER